MPEVLVLGPGVLQSCLRKVVGGVGGLDHAAWRTASTDGLVPECRGFIDGDLIEQFLELGPDAASGVAADMDIDVETLTRTIEELSRSCH